MNSNFDAATSSASTSFDAIRHTDASNYSKMSFDDKENMNPMLAKCEDLSLYEPSSSNSLSSSLYNDSITQSLSYPQLARSLFQDFEPMSQDSGHDSSFLCMNSTSDDFFEGCTDLELLDQKEKPNLPRDFDELVKSSLTTSIMQCSSSPVATSSPRYKSNNILQDSQRHFNVRLNRVGVKRQQENDNASSIYGNSICSLKKARSKGATTAISSSVSADSIMMLKKENIKIALQNSASNPDLIGDFSKEFCLPLAVGQHCDLKCITPHTLANLLMSPPSSVTYQVIDCRYPYEYDGGHIRNAINIYTKEQCFEFLHGSTFLGNSKKCILIFHCEFSCERGPNLCRYLRAEDRRLNDDSYPSLFYPELYLLDGGYSRFFEYFSHLCEPVAYKKMLHPDHENELRFFRHKSKTLNADCHETFARKKSTRRTDLQ